MKILSSAQTFWVKFVYPLFFFCGFGAGTLTMWTGSMVDRQGVPVAPEIKWLFLAGLVIGTALICWVSAGLKKVSVDDSDLHVSNYLKEITTPFANIADVTENRFVRGRPVTIHFRQPTAFGSKITFLPAMRMVWRGPQPVVAELKAMAAGAPASGGARVTYH